MDALRGAPAEPPQAVIQAIDRAVEQVLAGAPTVHIKGHTEHQCQVQLVPLFMEKAKAAGLEVEDTGLGRLRVGKIDVVFEPLYLAKANETAATTPRRRKPR
jgi:hypothetical protein